MADGDWPDQIWLFGSRARGDWDGWSDTDLLVVAAEQAVAERWADRLVAAGFAGDVIAMDRARWQALPSHASAIWRAVAREAIPLLQLEAA
jgi:predicted nucleotidyltransferase